MLVIAAVVAAATMPVLMRVARRLRLVDDTRMPPLPRIGGWAIALGTAAPLLLVGVIFVAAIGAIVLLVLLRVISGAHGRRRL